MPVLIANDSRLLPQTFEGGTITSKEIDNVTFNVGQLEHAAGRASSNTTGLAVAGGTEESNKFQYGGADWKVTKDLMLQYYYANLEDYYKQHFLGLVHVLPLGEDQSFKTDLRYFNSRLQSAQVVTPAISTEKVQIGSWVTYVDEENTEHRVQLVGEDQADAAAGLINWASPLGRALVGALKGDEVLWRRPAGDQQIEVILIEPDA